ncbi:MAG: ABC transporter ATP-binding protein [Proteobacteria bacterium]|nr:MAG: ABC transporter ATP-binding protein [Pseudomonadota bacterium]
MISLQGITKKFGAFTAVDEIGIDIVRGEFFSLLGPSGCGKTTLLRMIAGFEAPTSGRIFIDGVSMETVPPHLRPTNMVFQNYAIFPHLNVMQNVAYGLRKERLGRDELRNRVGDALAMVKLSGYEARRSNELSGGQRQRVALARALVKRPKVLLLDEPLGALDRKLREEMQLELRSLQRSVGITFVFVTHDQEEALTMSDRVAVMGGGRAIQVASPRDLYERPTSMEVAGFIGKMNFLRAKAVEIDGERVVVDTGGLGRVVARGEAGRLDGGSMVLAVRPEKLSLHTREPDTATRVRCRMHNTAYLGDRSHYFVTLDGLESPLAVSAQNADAAAARLLAEGDELWMSWTDDSLLALPDERLA